MSWVPWEGGGLAVPRGQGGLASSDSKHALCLWRAVVLQELCAPAATSKLWTGYPGSENCSTATIISPDLGLAGKDGLTLSSGNGLYRAQFSVHKPLATDWELILFFPGWLSPLAGWFMDEGIAHSFCELFFPTKLNIRIDIILLEWGLEVQNLGVSSTKCSTVSRRPNTV